MDGKKSNPGQLVVEIIVALVLVFLALAILNYTNILPVSKTLPFLSFLPSKGQTAENNNSGGGQNEQGLRLNVKNLVTPDSVKTYSNDTSEYTYTAVENSSAQVNGSFVIDMALTYDSANPQSDSIGGIMWVNEKEYTDPNYRALRVFRLQSEKSWVLEYRANGESKYFGLVPSSESVKSFARFRLLVSPDGKNIRVLGEGANKELFTLPSSLYETSNRFTAVVQTAPGSQIDVHSLYYEF